MSAQPEFSLGGEVLFRYYGSFGLPETPAPSAWMLAWGEALQRRGYFAALPNQYRVCDWVGALAAQFKWHIDNQRHGERIFVISLSGPREIGFREGEEGERYVMRLDAGDAYVMEGPARWRWQHCVLPVGRGRGGGRSFVVSEKRGAPPPGGRDA